MTRRPALPFLCALLSCLTLGCGDDGGASERDAAAITDGSTGGSSDASAIDAGSTPDAAVSGDAAQASFAPVDCRITSDCLGISTCNASAPGGICLGCGGAGDCGVDFECVAQGACARICSDDSDCNPAKRCSQGTGFCVIRTCSSDTPCPAPYQCSDPAGGLCQRPACNDTSCPDPFVCDSGSGLCMEPGA
jgi:hypothetical protein